MTKQKGPDKNLQNVAKDLEQPHVNAHYDNQMQLKTDTRRHWDKISADEEGEPSVGGLKHVETR
jgi:hypothetical protein